MTPRPHRAHRSAGSAKDGKFSIICTVLHCCIMYEHPPWQQLFPFFALHHAVVTLCLRALCGRGVMCRFALGVRRCFTTYIWNVTHEFADEDILRTTQEGHHFREGSRRQNWGRQQKCQNWLVLTPRPHRRRDAAHHVMQHLGNHCCQLGCSHTQCTAACVNSLTDNSSFLDVALRDALLAAHATCVSGA